MRILIVDDEKNIRRMFATALESADDEIVTAASGQAAITELRSASTDAVFLDLRLAQENGLDVLDEILRLSPQTSVVIVTAYASVETAVEAMRRGAFDYLAKPCTPNQIRQILAHIVRTKKLERRVAELESRLSPSERELFLLTTSPVMQKALDTAFRAAGSEATVLLLGENGTGKTVLAREMHRRSSRQAKPFVTVSCPSLSAELLESELFGHVKGAFTGAHQDTQGKVAAADGGTLFLDEIGELPLELQAKLLRLLQEREYERVGESAPRRANVRVISATNRDLANAVSRGNFREDLFYRLNVISVQMPPLRQRAEDIERLAKKFLAEASLHTGRSVSGISAEVTQHLERYNWPGNLRELRNVIERAVILGTSSQIETGDLPDEIVPSPEIHLGGRVTLADIGAEHIRRVISRTSTLEEAATILGVDPATLYRKRKRF